MDGPDSDRFAHIAADDPLIVVGPDEPLIDRARGTAVVLNCEVVAVRGHGTAVDRLAGPEIDRRDDCQIRDSVVDPPDGATVNPVAAPLVSAEAGALQTAPCCAVRLPDAVRAGIALEIWVPAEKPVLVMTELV